MDAAARAAQMERILSDLAADEDVEGCACITDDGFLLASRLTASGEAVIGEPTAGWLTHAVRIAKGLGLGEIRELSLRGSFGYALFVRAGPGQLLVVQTPSEATLALATLNARHAAHQLAALD